jgi:hypothetical protein
MIPAITRAAVRVLPPAWLFRYSASGASALGAFFWRADLMCVVRMVANVAAVENQNQ